MTLTDKEQYLLNALNLIVQEAKTEEVVEECIELLFTNESDETLEHVYEAFISSEVISILEECGEDVSEFLKDDSAPIGLTGVKKAHNAEVAKRREDRMSRLKGIAKKVIGARRERAENFAKVARDPELKNKPEVKHSIDLSQARLDLKAKRAEDIASGKLTPSYKKSEPAKEPTKTEAPKTKADVTGGKTAAMNKVSAGDDQAGKNVEKAKKEFEKATTPKAEKKKATPKAEPVKAEKKTEEVKTETVQETPKAAKKTSKGKEESSEGSAKTATTAKKTRAKKATKNTEVKEVETSKVEKETSKSKKAKEPETSKEDENKKKVVKASKSITDKVSGEVLKEINNLKKQRDKIEADLKQARETAASKPGMVSAINKYEQSLQRINDKISSLEGAKKTNEALMEVVSLLGNSTISESCFLEVLEMMKVSPKAIDKVHTKREAEFSDALSSMNASLAKDGNITPSQIKRTEKAGKRLDAFLKKYKEYRDK